MNCQSYGVHIALTKYPLGNEQDYIEKLLSLFRNYKKNTIEYIGLNEAVDQLHIEEAMQGLYKPVFFHMFSHFDIAFISLIDNFKFPQRVFDPFAAKEENIRSVSYQILSGEILNPCELSDLGWITCSKGEFIQIIQLKVNNGILVGNGIALFEECYTLIDKTLKSYDLENYLLIKSLNWGEFLLVVENRDPTVLTNALIRIRKLSLLDIEQEKRQLLINSSLYNSCYDDVENAHLFSESLSYFGVNYEKLEDLPDEQGLKSMIEWQVKPGHLPMFKAASSNLPFEVDDDYGNVFFKNGKTDYFIDFESKGVLLENKQVFKELRNNSELRKHIRKIKTKVLFPIDEHNHKYFREIERRSLDSPCDFEEILGRCKIIESKAVSSYLRKLNISRNIRKKVSKVIYNYNLGVQDPVLCIYFIDLYNIVNQFVNELKHLADAMDRLLETGEMSKGIQNRNYQMLMSHYIENELIQVHINLLENAFRDRILNNYNYEDINEFSLEINSSLTGVVSTIDTIVKFMGGCFRDDQGGSIVTTINDKATISDRISVNYNIEHLTNLPLVFATLMKEILNIDQTENEVENNQNFQALNFEFMEKKRQLPSDEKEFLLDFLQAYKFAYFEIDYKKFHLTFLGNAPLFIFWHWVYPFQCTHLYSSVGHFNEVNFVRELFRLLLVLKAAESPGWAEGIKCPIPELRNYWDRYFKRVLAIVEDISATESFKAMLSSLRKQVHNSVLSLDTKHIPTGKNNQRDAIMDIRKFLSKMETSSESKYQRYDVNGFVKFQMDEIKRKALQPDQRSTKSNYFNFLTHISYYNLMYIYDRFDGKVRILRRNYSNGNPVNHFLKNNITWYVDPFGGFFINDIKERKIYMELNNKMLHLLWHISCLLKKDIFKKAFKEFEL